MRVLVADLAGQSGAGRVACSGGAILPDSHGHVTFTNLERARGGVATVRSHSRLMDAAQIHADQMARVGRMDHVLAEATYPRPEDRINAVGYRWQAFAENVAFGQRGAAEVVEAWMSSPGHRTNIMNATYTEMGAGFARDGNGRPYYVQVCSAGQGRRDRDDPGPGSRQLKSLRYVPDLRRRFVARRLQSSRA